MFGVHRGANGFPIVIFSTRPESHIALAKISPKQNSPYRMHSFFAADSGLAQFLYDITRNRTALADYGASRAPAKIALRICSLAARARLIQHQINAAQVGSKMDA